MQFTKTTAAKTAAKSRKPRSTSAGYRACACRDCMETAIGVEGALCHACETAACDPDKECCAEGAYGG